MISVLVLLLASPLLAFGLFLLWSFTRKLSHKRQRWVWGGLLVPAVGLVLWTFGINFGPAPLQFYRVFGIWPAAEITGIDSATENWSDMGAVFLRFSGPPDAIASLIGQGFAPRARLPDGLSQGLAPDWWRLEACPGEALYYAASDINGWPNLTLAYCRETGQTLVEAHWLH